MRRHASAHRASGSRPLTKAGQDTLNSFKKQYGDKKGTQNFYATVNAKKAAAKKGDAGAKAWLKKVGEASRANAPVWNGSGFVD